MVVKLSLFFSTSLSARDTVRSELSKFLYNNLLFNRREILNAHFPSKYTLIMLFRGIIRASEPNYTVHQKTKHLHPELHVLLVN